MAPASAPRSSADLFVKLREDEVLATARDVVASLKWAMRDMDRTAKKLEAKIEAGDASAFKRFDADPGQTLHTPIRDMARFAAAVEVLEALGIMGECVARDSGEEA